jgi:uncharacterized protein (TIGR00269 family)
MEEKHPGIKFALFRSMERIRPFLELAAKEVKLQNCEECGEPTVGKVCKPCEMLWKLGVR